MVGVGQDETARCLRKFQGQHGAAAGDGALENTVRELQPGHIGRGFHVIAFAHRPDQLAGRGRDFVGREVGEGIVAVIEDKLRHCRFKRAVTDLITRHAPPHERRDDAALGVPDRIEGGEIGGNIV